MNYINKLTLEEFNIIENKVIKFFEWCTKTDIIETYHNYQQYKNGVFNPFHSKVNFLTRILTDKELKSEEITSDYIKYKWHPQSKYTFYAFINKDFIQDDLRIDNKPFNNIYDLILNNKAFGEKFNYNVCEIVKNNHKYDVKFNIDTLIFMCMYVYILYTKFSYLNNYDPPVFNGSIVPSELRYLSSMNNLNNDLNMLCIQIFNHKFILLNINDCIGVINETQQYSTLKQRTLYKLIYDDNKFSNIDISNYPSQLYNYFKNNFKDTPPEKINPKLIEKIIRSDLYRTLMASLSLDSTLLYNIVITN